LICIWDGIGKMQIGTKEDGQIDSSPNIKKPDWEDIFEAVGQSIMILDRDHRILAVNRATLNLTGLNSEDFLGMKCHEVMHGSLCPPEKCPMERMMETGEFQREEMLVEALGRFFLVSCSPIFNEENRIEQIIHIASDVTDSKRTKDELDTKIREIELLMDIIQHDIGNIHQGIKLFLQLAISRKGDDRSRLLNGALESSIRAERLTRNIKNFESLKEGNWEMIDVNLLEMVRESIETASMLHPQNQTRIRIDCAESVPTVKGNYLLEEMLVNLVDNALKYGSENDGEILIRIQSGNGDVEILIMDDGPGIPEIYRREIFQRYLQLERNQRKGSGIGLLICKKIANGMGVEISVMDRPDGRNGACFRLRFPRK
jgi:PAS domain S-box-containing protein